MSQTPTATIPRRRTLAPVAAPRPRGRFVTPGLLVAGVAAMLLGYLRMARANGVTADGAANALQAWDLLHGNVALSGWTLSDVSFYPTELVQYALIELCYGLNPDVVHVAAASTYVLLIVFASLVARGSATGRAAWLRVALVVAVMLVPEPGAGWAIVLFNPNHTGTGVPLLVAALLIDRRAGLRRWWPVAVTLVLTLAQMADPLALYIGALPLAAVSAYRLIFEHFARRSRVDRTPDANLLVAAVASAAIAHAAVKLIGRFGGYQVHEPIAEFTTWDAVPSHLAMLARATALDFGAYFPYLDDAGPALTALYGAAGAIKLLLMLAALVATVATTGRLLGLGRDRDDRVAQWLAAAIIVNLAAFVASTQAADMASARQVVVVLPFGAVLVARVIPAWVRAVPAKVVRGGAVLAAAVLVAAFAAQAAVAKPRPTEAAEVAAWLDAHDLRYGLGAYWASHTVTVATDGRVRVAPVVDEVPRAFHWESQAEAFDPRRHDARFVIVDRELERYGTLSGVVLQLGAPVRVVEFTRWTVLVYDHNVLPFLRP
ncbi:hypothetical protein ABT369_18595 [Dactylosporangium sp. NPDC000244]|uniref:hypothetical protein n=1 Tax=Dactylosporangium sp. NPDC000244 TaxID=3154365 RepID=UPI00332CF913